jgi:hypothetical protein
MATSDAFALRDSGLNAFLFAEVGTELNGTPLTILSVLARLGKDPWAEAAKWTKLPKAATIERLAGSIAQMPLPPQAIDEARATASRLVQLLPAAMPRPAAGPLAGSKFPPRWVVIAACCAAVALGFAFTLMPGSPKVQSLAPLTDMAPAPPPPAAK